MNRDKGNDKVYGSSPTADKVKGRANEMIGKVKTKVGSVTGDRDLQAEGYVQNAEGKTGRMKGEIKEKVTDAKNMLKAGVDAVKDKFHDLRRGDSSHS